MSYTLWSEYFEGDQLTDYSTVKFEEDRYTTSVIDISSDLNLTLQTRLVSAENFVLPSEAYLEVDYQLLKAVDSTAFAATDNIALVNGWSLFSKAELIYNGMSMETVDDPGTVSQMMGLLEDPEDYKSKGSLEYRFYDSNKQQTWVETAAGAAAATPSDAVIKVPLPASVATADGADLATTQALANSLKAWVNSNAVSYQTSASNSNKGQEARLARCPPNSTDNWIKLKLSDVFGICKVNKPVRGIQIELRLTKETNFNKCLMRGPAAVAPGVASRALTAEGKVVAKRMNLIMPSLKPHSDIFMKLNEKLVSKEAIPLDYQRIWCKAYGEKDVGGVGTTNYSKRILSNTKRPRHCFIALQNAERRSPSANPQTLNPLLFDMPTAVRAYVQVGNIRFPAMEYDSSQDGFIRLYNAFLNASGKNADALASSFLDFNIWKSLYPIFYFDLSHNDNQFELSMDSEITLNMTFDGAPALFNLVAIVISDEHKVIKEEGQVVTISTVDKGGERN